MLSFFFIFSSKMKKKMDHLLHKAYFLLLGGHWEEPGSTDRDGGEPQLAVSKHSDSLEHAFITNLDIKLKNYIYVAFIYTMSQ